jgi:low affinity Fe/Cu permease
MVFLIQRSQNKDSQAVHLKLNEIVAVLRRSNRLINVEDLTEHGGARTTDARRDRQADTTLTASHSVEGGPLCHKRPETAGRVTRSAPH